jgi:hypothetical protein
MDLSQPLIRRGMLLATLAAVSLGAVSTAAHASTDPTVAPYGLPYKGVLNLTLGGNAGQVAYVGNVPALSGVQQAIETSRRNDCRVKQPSATRLLDFSATHLGNTAPVGLVSGSMGVFSGSQGTPCSRISAGLNQTLAVQLGPVVTNAIPDAAFYRLELDLEAKGNLALDLEILRNGVVVDTYTLRTGSSIVPGVGYDLDGGFDSDELLPSVPGTERIFNCPAPKSGDSGPDAGLLDNCRWTLNELGHGFRLKPSVGDGSLEGGSDTPIATKIYLTEAVIGVLGCTPQTSNTRRLFGDDPQNPGSCQVTRVGVPGLACTPVGYILRNLTGDEEGQGCELLKSPGEQLVAYIDITFPVEPRTDIGAELPTTIAFTGGNQSFEPNRCRGTVVADNPETTDVVEGWTIAEVLSQPSDVGVVDQSPNTSLLDWACILDNSEWYLGNDEMQVTQTILFWGDISFSRN